MYFSENLAKAIQLYNQDKYAESHEILLAQMSYPIKEEEKSLSEALIKITEAMNFISNQQWDRAKDLFLTAWRKLREIDNASIDIDRLKEECYTAAVAAERIIMGEAEKFDQFYVPKISML